MDVWGSYSLEKCFFLAGGALMGYSGLALPTIPRTATFVSLSIPMLDHSHSKFKANSSFTAIRKQDLSQCEPGNKALHLTTAPVTNELTEPYSMWRLVLINSYISLLQSTRPYQGQPHQLLNSLFELCPPQHVNTRTSPNFSYKE